MEGFFNKNKNYGQSLIEVVIALAVFAIFASGVVVALLQSYSGATESGLEERAWSYLQEGIEAVRSIRDNGYNRLVYAQSGVELSGGYWQFKGEGTIDSADQFTRTLQFASVYRDGNDDIVDPGDPGAVFDVHTKMVTATVTWPTFLGINRQIQNIILLSEWDRDEWIQTDWIGGPGQAEWLDQTKYYSDDSNIDASTVGEIKIQQTEGTALERWIPGGGLTVTHTTDVDFNAGVYNDTKIESSGVSASVVLADSEQWGTYMSTADSLSGNMLEGIDFYSGTLGYLVGRNGTVGKWNGTNWSAIDAGTGVDLLDVFVLGANNVWITGRAGLIKNWNGFQWLTIPSGSGRNLNKVQLVSGSDGWITGRSGTILRWNGAVWTSFSSPVGNGLEGLHMLSSTDGFIVGGHGTILRWNGTSWIEQTSPTAKDLFGVHCLDSVNCWAVGGQGEVIYFNGTTWVIQSSPGQRELHEVYMTSTTHGIAVGGNGVGQGEILRWNGSSWQLNTPGTINGLNDVDLLSATDGQAVGGMPNEALLMDYNGTTWIDITGTLGSNDIYDLKMNSANDGWAVGSAGVIYHWLGADWVNTASPTNKVIYSVDSTGLLDGFAVGYNGDILQYNGTVWSLISSPTGNQLNEVQMLDGNDAWAVGNSGTIIHWDGTSWSTVASPTAADLTGLYFISASNGFAVGAGGVIIQWNGTIWTTVASPTMAKLNSVYFLDANAAWAVGAGGVIIYWNGAVWVTVTSPTGNNLNQVKIASSSSGYAVGDGGVIIKWNGTDWITMTSPTAQNLNAVYPVLSNNVWAAGNLSVFVHYQNMYPYSGTYLSSVIDSGNVLTHWDYVTWVEDTDNANTDLQIDTRTGNTPTPDGTWSAFGGTYTNPLGEAIVSPVGQYLQYRITLSTADQRYTSKLKEITINFNNPTTNNLNSLNLISDTFGYTVGNSGDLVNYNGITWALASSPTVNNLFGTDFIDNNNGWAVGGGGTIVRYNSGSWAAAVSPTVNDLMGISMVDATFGAAVGNAGTIIHWNGSAWSSVSSPTVNRLNSVYFTSATQGFAVGAGGVILSWNGTAWSSISSPTANNLNKVFLTSATSGWAVGDGGVIVRWNGTAWSGATSPTTTNLTSVYIFAANNGWAVGDSGTILRFKGVSWALFTSPTTNNLNDIYLDSAVSGWLVGDGGFFMHLEQYDEGGDFQTYAQLVSSAYDTGYVSDFNTLSWTEDLTCSGSSSASNDWDFSNPAHYAFDSSKIEVTAGVARLKGSGGDNWWDTGYAYRQKITVTNNDTVTLPTGYSTNVSLNHYALVQAAKSLASGDDIRIVYWNGASFVELDRINETVWNTNGTNADIWFKTQASINSGANDQNYYLYYGNSMAGSPPANRANVYVFYDDFESGNLNNWTNQNLSWLDATVVGNYNLNTTANSVFVSGARAYVGGASNGGVEFFVFDISNPTAPSLLGSLNIGNNTINGVYVIGDYAYLATSNNSQELAVVNVTNPASMSIVGSYNADSNSDGYDVFVAGNYAYLVTASNSSSGANPEFYIINISNPASPSLTGSYQATGNPNIRGVKVSGNYAYLASADDARELTVLNITNPAAPSLAGAYNAAGTADGYDVFVSGTTAFLTRATSASPEFYTLNIANPAAPAFIGSMEVADIINSVYVPAGSSYAFLGTDLNTQSLQIVDISNLATPSLFAAFNFGSDTNGVFVDNDIIYCATEDTANDFKILQRQTVWNIATDQKYAGTYALKASPVTSSDRYLTANGITQNNMEMESYWRFNGANTSTIAQGFRSSNSTPINQYETTKETTTGWNISKMINGVYSEIAPNAGVPVNNTWTKITTQIDGTSMKVLKDGAQIVPGSGFTDVGAQLSSGTVGFRAYNIGAGTNWWLDNVKVRKFQDPEPTTAFGVEETNASYPTDRPSINPTVSFIPGQVNVWTGFTESASKNGGEIYYQLSDNDGASWKYWNGSAWVAAGALNYNTAAVINTNIGSFDATAGQVMFRAFLESDGEQQVILNNVNIGYSYSSGGACDIQVQIKTADSLANLTGAEWSGPEGKDGDETDYFTSGVGILIHPDHNGDRWLEYKVILIGNGDGTPVLNDLTLTYTNWNP